MAKRAFPFDTEVAFQRASGMDFDKVDRIRRELGLNGLTVMLPPDFDDPAFSRQVLGPEE